MPSFRESIVIGARDAAGRSTVISASRSCGDGTGLAAAASLRDDQVRLAASK